jgi:hypothetical protein
MFPQMTLFLQKDQIVILSEEMFIIQRTLLNSLTGMFSLLFRRHITVTNILSKSSWQDSIGQQSFIPFKVNKPRVRLRSKGSSAFIEASKTIEIHRHALGIMHHEVKEILSVPRR